MARTTRGQKEKKNQGGRNDMGRPGKLLLVHRLNKAFGLKLLIFLFKGVGSLKELISI